LWELPARVNFDGKLSLFVVEVEIEFALEFEFLRHKAQAISLSEL